MHIVLRYIAYYIIGADESRFMNALDLRVRAWPYHLMKRRRASEIYGAVTRHAIGKRCGCLPVACRVTLFYCEVVVSF